MSLLLNWRVWVALALAGLLAYSHIAVYRHGKQNERSTWLASVAAANAESRRLENARQSAADSAARESSKRQGRIISDSVLVRSELERMRDAADAAERAAEKSAAAASQYRAACTKLLKEGGGLLEEIAGAADKHSSDVTLLLDAWPR